MPAIGWNRINVAHRAGRYDPCWPSLFEERAMAVTTLLFPFVSEIHHIGSTAVPGLAAKPKIDIDVVVSDQRMVAEMSARLRSAGYTFHGDPYACNLWTFTADTRPCGTRLYLCETGNAAHAARLLFRDALREHQDLARRYDTLKRRLAREAKGDWDIYTNGKRGFINEVLALAATKKGPAVASGAL
ncbi:GrpB family protein [Ensifer sesbaniae]|uniref:GrpB family protein n=1 Tax=Ensifer sesbaniae TaxID=1214071 RepID=UPI00249E021B|nr:GrpB family protein [Ensifer sesbaniae]